MNVQKLQEDLKIDEGIIYRVYLDHLGYPTFGIGHLITESDPEHGMDVDTPVSPDRVDAAFEADVESVIKDCKRLYDQWEELPEQVQLIIANMMFNMGYTRLSKFKGMKAGVDNRDWKRAAEEMVDSRWYEQVTTRAERLVTKMRLINSHDIYLDRPPTNWSI